MDDYGAFPMEPIRTVALLHLRTHAQPLVVLGNLLFRADSWIHGALLVLPEAI
jgi:hypothetical protein